MILALMLFDAKASTAFISQVRNTVVLHRVPFGGTRHYSLEAISTYYSSGQDKTKLRRHVELERLDSGASPPESWKTAQHCCQGMLSFPVLTILPIYSFLFGILVPRPMWNFSSILYNKLNGKGSFLFEHFARRTKSIELAYRLHPLLASGALSTLGIFFAAGSFARYHLGTLLRMNAFFCISSGWFGGRLIRTMYGNRSARWWTRIQQYLTSIYATLALVAYSVGINHSPFVAMNFSLLFCA